MSKIAVIAVAALCMSIVFVLLLIWRSPEGDENEKGFHLGATDKSPDAQAGNESNVQPQKVASSASAAPVAAKK